MSVLVEQKKPVEALSAEDLIPPDVNGARTDVVEIGRLEAFTNPRDRFRPNIPAGVSIGHYMVTAGTLGAIVMDRNTGEPLILSNNHVSGQQQRGRNRRRHFAAGPHRSWRAPGRRGGQTAPL